MEKKKLKLIITIIMANNAKIFSILSGNWSKPT